jgi:hypothetical protein
VGQKLAETAKLWLNEETGLETYAIQENLPKLKFRERLHFMNHLGGNHA